MKPTVYDIAKESGVSLATVDRVLNNRPGVRAATQDKVQKAILRIGYVRDIGAANLARRKTYRFAFLLPNDQNQFVDALRATLHDLETSQIADRTTLDIRAIPIDDPHQIARDLDNIGSEKFDGMAIMAPETPQVRDAIARLKAQGIAVVAMVSDQPNSARDHFAGINNIAAGRTAAVLMGRFLHREKAKVLVLSHAMQARDSMERRLGFDAVLNEQFENINVLPTIETHGDILRAEQAITRAAQTNPDIAGVYLLVSADRELLGLLRGAGLLSDCVNVAHDLTHLTREALICQEIDAVITQNGGHLVRSALRVLRARCDGVEIDQSQERIRIEIVLRENLP